MSASSLNEVVVRKKEPFARIGKIIAVTTPRLQFSARQSVIRAMRQRVQTAIDVLAGLDELNAQWEKKAIRCSRVGLAGWSRVFTKMNGDLP